MKLKIEWLGGTASVTVAETIAKSVSRQNLHPLIISEYDVQKGTG